MTKYILEAITDSAETALFSFDQLTEKVPSNWNAYIAELEKDNQLIRQNFHSDGQYVMWLYVEESPPDEVMRYFTDNPEKFGDGELDFAVTNKKVSIKSGKIAFTGLEYATLSGMKHPKSETVEIPSGIYNVCIFSPVAQTIEQMEKEELRFDKKIFKVIESEFGKEKSIKYRTLKDKFGGGGCVIPIIAIVLFFIIKALNLGISVFWILFLVIATTIIYASFFSKQARQDRKLISEIDKRVYELEKEIFSPNNISIIATMQKTSD